MKKNEAYFQLAWGIALVLMGVAVFFRIPQVMPQIKKIAYFASIIGFVYFCFYLIAILLIVGGARKIYNTRRHLKADESDRDQ